MLTFPHVFQWTIQSISYIRQTRRTASSVLPWDLVSIAKVCVLNKKATAEHKGVAKAATLAKAKFTGSHNVKGKYQATKKKLCQTRKSYMYQGSFLH